MWAFVWTLSANLLNDFNASVRAGTNSAPISSPTSPRFPPANSNCPINVSSLASDCPPNFAFSPANALSNLSALPTTPWTSIPYRDKAFVDEPTVFPTKSAAAAKSIPLAEAKSSVAFVALLIDSSSSM